MSYHKLTPEQIIFIRSFPRYRGVIKNLARQFGVCRNTITSIRSNRTYVPKSTQKTLAEFLLKRDAEIFALLEKK